MAKKTSKAEKSSKGSSSSAKAKSKAASTVVANVRLVAAIKNYSTSLEETKSYLVTIGEIAQNEQLTRPEVVASLMEARGIEKSTAESQYSRMKGILTDPDVLEKLRNGDIDLKAARDASVKKQKNPSAQKKSENIEKRFAKAVTQIVECSKEGGYDQNTVINTVKSALKKGGIK